MGGKNPFANSFTRFLAKSNFKITCTAEEDKSPVYFLDVMGLFFFCRIHMYYVHSKRMKVKQIRLLIRSLVLSLCYSQILKLPVQQGRTNPRFMSLALWAFCFADSTRTSECIKREIIRLQIRSFVPSLCQTSMLLVDSNAERGQWLACEKAKMGSR